MLPHICGARYVTQNSGQATSPLVHRSWKLLHRGAKPAQDSATEASSETMVERQRERIRRRVDDRRDGFGRRMVRDRRREAVPVPVERRSGTERRSDGARRSGEERRPF